MEVILTLHLKILITIYLNDVTVANLHLEGLVEGLLVEEDELARLVSLLHRGACTIDTFIILAR